MAVRPNENLTDEQSKVLQKAAHRVVSARAEARSMLEGAGIELPPEDDWFGNPCGVRSCGCSDYTGDGGPCEMRITGPGGGAFIGTCGHPPSEHLPT
jgi:hypothetical protein